MSSESVRDNQGSGSWVLASVVLVIVAALFSSSREKPPFLFALGFGLVLGMALRLVAGAWQARSDRRLPWIAALIVACGFVLSFVPSYQRAARQWDRAAARVPSDPIAAALLKSAEAQNPDPQVPRYSISQYLQERFRDRPSPWPLVLYGAELLSCGLLAAGCVAWRSRP